MSRRRRPPDGMDPATERLTRVRVAAVDEAVGIGLTGLAAAADTSNDQDEILDAAVRDIARRLYLDEDQARLAILAGIIVGSLARALRGVD